MDRICPLGKARCEVRCGASVERRNVADGLIRSTEGRLFAPAGGVTAPLWTAGPRRGPCLAGRREKTVKPMLPGLILL